MAERNDSLNYLFPSTRGIAGRREKAKESNGTHDLSVKMKLFSLYCPLMQLSQSSQIEAYYTATCIEGQK